MDVKASGAGMNVSRAPRTTHACENIIFGRLARVVGVARIEGWLE